MNSFKAFYVPINGKKLVYKKKLNNGKKLDDITEDEQKKP
jgi:hypothetical protein